MYTPVETEPTEPEPTEPETTTHTVTFRVTYSGSSYGYTVKTMTVNDGYVLTDDDYPSVGMGNYGITWQRYTNPITSDVTINGSYSWGGMSGYSLNRSAAEVDTITEEYDYIYAGGKLMREVVTTTEGGTTTTRTLDFFYDANGTPYALKYNGTVYYYVTNLQGDVTKLVTSNGATAASYEYDPYGNNISAAGDLAEINPIRYRGYYYDTETGFYYVSSRYYDPEIGRWINADIPETLTADFENFAQYNLFAYCFNNPVNMSDETGTWPSWAKKVVAAVAVVAVVAAVAAVTVATAGAGTAAAVIAVGAAKGAAIGMASGAAIGAATGAVSHRVSTGSWSGAGTAALNGMGDGALSGAVTGAITGAAGSAVKVSQAAKAWDSGTFKSGYQSMKYHYNKHVVSEGLTKGNNVLKYTQDAVRFANRNSSVLKYTYNYNYGNASWNLTYSTGQGGMFTSAGKILTFWYR